MTEHQQRSFSDALSANEQRPDGSSGLSVLLVDDNPHVAQSLAVALRLAGHDLDHAQSPDAARSHLAEKRFDVLLLDLNFSEGATDGREGLNLLERLLRDDPARRIVIITAHSGVRIAVEAMRAGACDFVMKPWRNAELVAKLERAAALQTPVEPVPASRPTGAVAGATRLIGESPAMIHIRDMIRRIGPTSASVAVTGPSGSGRSLVASALHQASAHAQEPATCIDLRDREMWGLLEQAPATLVLEHPDTLEATDQRRLLARLSHRSRCITIAADLRGLAPALVRRLAAVVISIPPLGARGEDALVLARHFVRLFARRYGREEPVLSRAAQDLILSGVCPDDVRGLSARVERAVLLSDGPVLDGACFVAEEVDQPVDPASQGDALAFNLEANERAVIEAALHQHHYNVTHAAQALGLSRAALYRRLERYGI